MLKDKATLDREIAEILRKGRELNEGRDAYPNDLRSGDLVMRRDVKGRKKYQVSHVGRSGGFVQVYTREVSGGSGGIVTFDRSQLKMADH